MIRILHGADLHLDSPFSAMTAEDAAKSRALQRQLPGALVQLANEKDCHLLLLAGDVFDSAAVYPETVQALQTALASFRGHVFIAPGNHDPYTVGSVWARTQWPENVHIFREDCQCIELPELGCCVHGGAFLSEECYEPIPQIRRQGYVHIGVFHGELTTQSPYRPIDKEEIRLSGLDYLALGHIHQRSMPRQYGSTWFGWPGVAMGRGFDETGACGALYVQLENGGCAAQFLPLQAPVYEILRVASGTEPDFGADSGGKHCRIHLVGQEDEETAEELYWRWAPRFLSLQIVDERTPARDLWEACGDGTLRGLALDALKATEPPALAELAAAYLLAALEGREEP